MGSAIPACKRRRWHFPIALTSASLLPKALKTNLETTIVEINLSFVDSPLISCQDDRLPVNNYTS